ncbi:MAG: tetratricopeptide repeat protein [Myxococcota bacterium]
MKIRCPSCSKSFDVDSSEAKSGSMVTCPHCSNSFEASAAGDSPGVTLQGQGSGSTGKQRYFVKRPTGKVFGPFDKNAVQMMLKANKLDADAQLSTDKEDWKTLAEIPDFAKYAEVDVPADNPKGTVMGGWNSGGPMGGGDSDLPKSADQGDNLPKSAGDGGSNLPRPQGGGPPNLPKPKSSGGGNLPKSKAGGANLPKSKSGGPPELPRPKGSADNLPKSKSPGSELPRSAEADLPKSAGTGGGKDNLPRSTAHLPKSKTQTESSGSGAFDQAEDEDDLFAPPGSSDQQAEADQVDSLFGEDSAGEDDLFAAPSAAEEEDDLFGGPEPAAEQEEDDLFAAPEPEAQADEDDLFGGPGPAADEDEEDLFGAPEPEEEEDDLFGGPGEEEEDLFGAPEQEDEDDLFDAPDDGGDEDDLFGDAGGGGDAIQHNQIPMEEDDDDLFGGGGGDDDLFGAPPGGGEDEDDLFAASERDESMFGEDEGDEDDFLGGDDSFSFLDDERPEPEADEEESWGDDLMGNQAPEADSMGAESADDWGDDLLEDTGGDQADADIGVDSPYDNDDPFRPASRGVQQPASTGISAQTTKDQAVEEDKKRGLMTLVGVPVLALLVIGGVGFAAYNAFFKKDDSVTEQKVVEKGPVEVDLSAFDSGNFASLRQTIDESRGGELDEANQGRLLLMESLFLTRYDDPEVASHADSLAQKFQDSTEGWPAVGRGAWEAQAGNADAARTYLEPLVDGETGYYAQLMMGVGDVKALDKMLESSASPQDDAGSEKENSAESDTEAAEDTNGEESEGEEGASDEEKVAEADDAAPEDESEDGGADEPAADVKSGQEPEIEAPPSDDPSAQAEVEELPSGAEPLASRARKALDRAAASDKRAEPYYWKGYLESRLGQDETAVDVWKEGVEAQPDHVATRLSLARTQYRMGELNSATKHLEQITEKLAPSASTVEKARAWHYQGMLHVARRKSDEAVNAFTKALSIDASRTDTLRALAEEYERAEKYKEALNFFTTNKDLGQKDPDVMLGIVRSHMGLEQWSEAISQLEQGEKLFPKDARFPYYLGQLNLKRGAFFDAQKSLESAVDIDPTLLLAHAKLAQLAWKVEEDIEKGEGHVEDINKFPDLLNAEVATEVATYYAESGRRDIAEQWYRAALGQDTNYWPARLALARLLLERGEDEKALGLLERAREEGVEDIRLSAYLADAYRQSEKYDRAVDQINRVIEEFPKNEEYVFIRGRIYFDRGNYDTARQDFNKAYELNPRYHKAYFYVGRTAFEQEDYDTATRIFRHVLDYRPNDGEFHYWMGRAYEQENRTGQALEEYRKASAVDEAYAVRNPELFIRRGRLLARLGYSNEGRKDIERALELAPKMDEALIAMGETNFDDKMYDEAIDNFTKALVDNPERPSAQYKLGMALIYNGQDNKGIQHLQRAVQYGYEDPEVFRTLGYKYKELGKRQLAIKSFKEFLKKTAKKENIPPQTKREMIDQIQEMGGSL